MDETDFRALVDASPAIIWMTDVESRCTYLSRQWYEFTGRSPEQDLGFGWLENIHPDDLEKTAQVYTAAVENRGELKVDYRLRTKAGDYRWAIDIGHPRFDVEGRFLGYIGTVTDIHERIIAEREFLMAKTRFERSARATDLGIWYCDLPFADLIWNEQVKNHFWLPPDAHVTIDTFYERIHPDDREKTRLAIAESNAKKREYDIVYRTTNPANEAQIKFIRAMGWTDFAADGTPIRFDGLTLDITSDKVAQAELEEAKTLAEAANLSKTEFLANMSHEIRTPLGAILGFTDLLRDAKLPQRERDNYFETISRNGKALTRIVDDILDLAKVESGKMEMEAVSVSFYDLMQDSIALFQERAKEKGIYLLLNIHDSVPNEISTDPTRVRQIILNLVGNAVKFTAVGGVRVKVSSHAVSAEKVRITVCVEDTGVGIEPEKRVRLFQPFAQADSSTTRKFGGTGLGLALSQRLASALGGRVALSESPEHSDYRKGTTFFFEFEAVLAKPASKADVAPTKSSSSLVGSNQMNDLRILVVDDSADNRVLLNRVLSKAGIQVTEAGNGKEAVDLAMKSSFDLIFMDVQMPEMDGYQATQMLRAKGYTKPIVALSAHAMKEDFNRSLRAGCNTHLTKPIRQAEIYSTISELTAPDSSAMKKS